MATGSGASSSDGARLLLDSGWQFPELSILTARYSDLYGFFYSLRQLKDDRADHRADEIFQAYPWHVGYSSLNFFRDLYFAVPQNDKLTLVEIRYASPGFIELIQDSGLIGVIWGAIRGLGPALGRANKIFDDIHASMTKRRLANLDVRRAELVLAKEELQFVVESTKMLADQLQLDPLLRSVLNRRTLGNSLLQLKILQAVFRRTVPLAKLLDEGKLVGIEPSSRDRDRR